MMSKAFVTTLVLILVNLGAFHELMPGGAEASPQVLAVSSAFPLDRTNLPMPPPQEPLDRTPITPVETVGAAAREPF